ncbi:unannotated protein [freshwater metagenome]|uniref:Unannotated protein n=1 Tax=freshwater metagenome TaxID=449393 RepID=A0A6J7J0I5_9ZZZZ
MTRSTTTVVPPSASSVTSMSTEVDPVRVARSAMKSGSEIISRTASGGKSYVCEKSIVVVMPTTSMFMASVAVCRM